MPDFSDFKAVPDSVYEELFDNTVKLESSSPFTKNIDLRGSKALVVFQKANLVSTSARTFVSSQNWTNQTVVIDDNLNTVTAHVYCVAGFSGGSPLQALYVIDFGSIAVRNISTKARASMGCNSSGSGSRNIQINVEYSTDNVSYSGGGVVASATGAPSGGTDNTATRTDNAVNMRYARVFSTGTGGTVCNGNGSLFEIWEPGTGGGSATLTFEVFNEVSQAWETYDLGFGSLPVQSSQAGGSQNTSRSGVLDSEVRNFPKGAGKIRAKYTITDGCDAQAGVLKIFD